MWHIGARERAVIEQRTRIASYCLCCHRVFHIFYGLCVTRQPTQDAPEEVRTRDFRRELEERERVAVREKTRERGPRGENSLLLPFLLTPKYRWALLYIRSWYLGHRKTLQRFVRLVSGEYYNLYMPYNNNSNIKFDTLLYNIISTILCFQSQ